MSQTEYGPISWERMINAVEKVRARLDRAVAALEAASIPYAVVAMSTDYDCWKTDEEPVSWDAILAVFNSNARKVTTLLCDAIPEVARRHL